jgi:hypothetical protein
MALSTLETGTAPASLSTVVREGDDVFMLAAHPVRENMLLNSPKIGVLLMARKLAHEELARVSQTLMAPATLEGAGTHKAHARLKFFDLHAANQGQIAEFALQQFGRVYEIEREVRELPTDQRQAIRQQQTKPLLDALHKWLLLQRHKVP